MFPFYTIWKALVEILTVTLFLTLSLNNIHCPVSHRSTFSLILWIKSNQVKYLSNFIRLFLASLERMLGTFGDCEILDKCWSGSGGTKYTWGNFIRPRKEIQSNKMCDLHRKSRYMIFHSRQILLINKVQYFVKAYSEPCVISKMEFFRKNS